MYTYSICLSTCLTDVTTERPFTKTIVTLNLLENYTKVFFTKDYTPVHSGVKLHAMCMAH